MLPSVAQGERLAVGTNVEVFSTYRQAWVRGFSIAAVVGDRYALRRTSDGAVLGRTVSGTQVRQLVPAVSLG